MYDWRRMTGEDRARVLETRRARHQPWHSPPHWEHLGEHRYLISAACYEHAPIIGKSPDRMTECEAELLRICREFCTEIHGWCILPNHDHLLVRTERITELLYELGQFHGRSSFAWNGEDDTRGRKVWCNCFERRIRSERHFWASLNYVHHNPVHHGYVKSWSDWPWSSAAEFLRQVGRDKAMKIWKRYPVLDYGKKWDP
ncbi:MAG: transposase [Acidobacteria bacterium]|nr:transposase [Acidobacteriota bacterium]